MAALGAFYTAPWRNGDSKRWLLGQIHGCLMRHTDRGLVISECFKYKSVYLLTRFLSLSE